MTSQSTAEPPTPDQRRKRANGVASREAILEAAAHIAGERGYQGTSVKAVSDRSGLPASSIYWHFANKDELIAAVIDTSFSAWVDALRQRSTSDAAGGDAREVLIATFRHSARQLREFPDFLGLGLMLLLEHRPTEPTARARFRQVRAETLARIASDLRRTFPALTVVDANRLATLVLAASDGLFVAADVEHVNLEDAFETLAIAVHGAVVSLLGDEPTTNRLPAA